MTPTASPLKQQRLNLGLRQADVAARADCSISLVSMTESGYRPSLPTRERLAVAVGASVGSFWPEQTA